MKIGDFITGVAVVAFILALCSIESLSIGTFAAMFISGAWIVGYSWFKEEEERLKGGRY